jgi:cytochrome oxidase Cu insertion factor (SCO1/SenC/PrrC family)
MSTTASRRRPNPRRSGCERAPEVRGPCRGLARRAAARGHGRGLFARDAARPEGLKAGAFDPVHAAPEFALRGSDGSEVTLARYRGKAVLLTFGFTHCAAVCPTTLATLRRRAAGSAKAADSVQVIYVTVDPERDSAEHMRDYLAAFDRSFIGATGEPKRWRRCARSTA